MPLQYHRNHGCIIFISASKIDGVRSEMYGMRQDINAEMKDFHGRLCTIEERKK